MSQQEKADHEIRFPVGSCVSYRADGICDIVDIRFESFSKGGNEMEYYVLAPRNDPNCRTFVPVKNPELTAMMSAFFAHTDISRCQRDVIKNNQHFALRIKLIEIHDFRNAFPT